MSETQVGIHDRVYWSNTAMATKLDNRSSKGFNGVGCQGYLMAKEWHQIVKMSNIQDEILMSHDILLL